MDSITTAGSINKNMMIIISSIIVFLGFYLAFVIKWGWKTGNIIVSALLIAILITSGAIGFLF